MDGFGNENGAEVAAPGGWGDTDTAPSVSFLLQPKLASLTCDCAGQRLE